MTNDPDDVGFGQALERLHAAMARVAMGDVSLIKALHSKRDDVTSFYGWGGYEKGWAAVSKRWDWAGTQFLGGMVAHETVSTIVSGDLAYAAQLETFNARRPGGPEPVQWTNRVTHIFRREDGEWRLVHRHANRLEGNPAAVAGTR
jgi:ketosteroid isomerase-like protein